VLPICTNAPMVVEVAAVLVDLLLKVEVTSAIVVQDVEVHIQEGVFAELSTLDQKLAYAKQEALRTEVAEFLEDQKKQKISDISEAASVTLLEAEAALEKCNGDELQVTMRITTEPEFLRKLRLGLSKLDKRKKKCIVVRKEPKKRQRRETETLVRQPYKLSSNDALMRLETAKDEHKLDDLSEGDLGRLNWSGARINAFLNRKKNENAYYYRFNEFGEEPKTGEWSKEETQRFLASFKKVGRIIAGAFSVKSCQDDLDINFPIIIDGS